MPFKTIIFLIFLIRCCRTISLLPWLCGKLLPMQAGSPGHLCVNTTSIYLIHLLYGRKHAPLKCNDFCSLYWPRLNLKQWFINNLFCVPLLTSSAKSPTLQDFFFTKRMLTCLKELTFYPQKENLSIWNNMGIWLTYPLLPRSEWV